jgi:hypothetical protein
MLGEEVSLQGEGDFTQRRADLDLSPRETRWHGVVDAAGLEGGDYRLPRRSASTGGSPGWGSRVPDLLSPALPPPDHPSARDVPLSGRPLRREYGRRSRDLTVTWHPAVRRHDRRPLVLATAGARLGDFEGDRRAAGGERTGTRRLDHPLSHACLRHVLRPWEGRWDASTASGSRRRLPSGPTTGEMRPRNTYRQLWTRERAVDPCHHGRPRHPPIPTRNQLANINVDSDGREFVSGPAFGERLRRMAIHAAQAEGPPIRWLRGRGGQLSSRTLRVSTCCWKTTALPPFIVHTWTIFTRAGSPELLRFHL